MTRFVATTLDLSNLPAPNVIKTLDYEAIVAARKASLVSSFAAQGIAYDVSGLETDPAILLQETDAYRELLCRGSINDAAKAVMLAFATGSDLEHLATMFGISRRVIVPATENAPAVLESDAELRRRVQIAPEAYSTCGSRASYIHHALDAVPALVDAAPIVATTASGQVQVRVVCLDRGMGGIPSVATLDAVRLRLNRADVRPATVPVSVSGPSVAAYSVEARLQIMPGPDPSLLRLAANQALTATVAGRRGLGVAVLRQALEAAARVSGVERVVLTRPAADIEIAADQVAIAGSIAVTTEVLDG